ncbi:DUF4365 domain-containing protein [Kitasatospora purpeofusca]|uniref:DUF4365 domain-containing protein n=1 Tax=Kitasatospora purpeofusca TaxID=67352 RepID=UPI00365C0816
MGHAIRIADGLLPAPAGLREQLDDLADTVAEYTDEDDPDLSDLALCLTPLYPQHPARDLLEDLLTGIRACRKATATLVGGGSADADGLFATSAARKDDRHSAGRLRCHSCVLRPPGRATATRSVDARGSRARTWRCGRSVAVTKEWATGTPRGPPDGAGRPCTIPLGCQPFWLGCTGRGRVRGGIRIVATISASWKIGRSGVNALRTLLEEHDHLVQEIGGGADHGEDLYVGFASGGRRTGHFVAVQVKSGKRYKRAKGYAIPVADHRQDWKDSRLPVVGVVYDRDQKRLFWVNLTQELQRGSEATWIQIPEAKELTEATLGGFVSELQTFIDVQGMCVSGETEDARRVATAVSKAPTAATRRKSIGANQVVGTLGILLMVAYLILMAVMFMAMTVPVLRAEGEGRGFSVASPLGAILTCLVAGTIGTAFHRNMPARIALSLGVLVVCLNNYQVFNHYNPLDNLSGWSLMVMTILCETTAFACAPQIVYRFAVASRSSGRPADPA